jgi:hypothetical protein
MEVVSEFEFPVCSVCQIINDGAAFIISGLEGMWNSALHSSFTKFRFQLQPLMVTQVKSLIKTFVIIILCIDGVILHTLPGHAYLRLDCRALILSKSWFSLIVWKLSICSESFLHCQKRRANIYRILFLRSGISEVYFPPPVFIFIRNIATFSHEVVLWFWRRCQATGSGKGNQTSVILKMIFFCHLRPSQRALSYWGVRETHTLHYILR